MTLCAFIKPGGDRCGATAMKGYSTCYGHRPDLADERKRNASRGGRAGGRGRPSSDLAPLKRRLEDLAEDVLEGNVERGNAAVASQIYNVLLRAVSVEMKVKEQQELEERLAELETMLGQRGQQRWG